MKNYFENREKCCKISTNSGFNWCNCDAVASVSLFLTASPPMFPSFLFCWLTGDDTGGVLLDGSVCDLQINTTVQSTTNKTTIRYKTEQDRENNQFTASYWHGNLSLSIPTISSSCIRSFHVSIITVSSMAKWSMCVYTRACCRSTRVFRILFNN